MTRRKDQIDHSAETPTVRFLRSAQKCRARDLQQLYILGELVKGLSALIHALQKERGASSIFLGSSGATFADQLALRIAESRELEAVVRSHLEHVDERLDRMSAGARFYTRVAFAFQALEALPDTRARIAALTLAPQDAVKSFTDLISQLLAVGFEAANVAADPDTSRALVALVNFSQGKEYAGQERATAGAAFSRRQLDSAEQRRLHFLAQAQEQAFRIFAEFANPTHVVELERLATGEDAIGVQRMRRWAFEAEPSAGGPVPDAAQWYELTTRRIDGMKLIEDRLSADLGALCASKLAHTERSDSEPPAPPPADSGVATTPLALLIADVDPARNNSGLTSGIGVYTLDGALPKPMRSILDVVEAQSRHIEDVSHQLESARTALAERKTIDRAKGILMSSRRMSETDAYSLMRQTAMNQNKRLVEVADAIVSMAEILKA